MKRGIARGIGLLLAAAPFLLYAVAQTSRLHDAVLSGNMERVSSALKPWKSLDGRARNGKTALDLAMEANNVDIARMLVERGASIQFTTGSGERVDHLERAVSRRKPAFRQLFLEKGADPNDGKAVFAAVQSRDLETLRLLLDRGAYPHRDALLEAARARNLEMIRLLLDHDAIPDPALSIVLQYPKGDGTALKIADLLVQRGASLTTEMADGRTLARTIIQGRDPATLRWMIDRGYPVNQADSRGNTALHYAAITSGEAVSLLINGGAKPNVENENGMTPLALAAQDGHLTNTILLLKSGADPNLGRPGKRPIELALRLKHYVLLGPLREHGARE
jgi:ankyrin repeat protein